jgi:FtsP/CotA-like multicopper oxidase with cupredoxin domain
VYIEPKHERCRYDKEAFLTTHEWEPYFSNDELDEQASEPVAQQAKERNIVTAEMAHEHWEIGYKSASINGRALGHGEPIRVKFGDHVLFHLLNASATENVRLSLPGHRFKVVALDGNPVPMPAFVDVLELGVGERIDAVVEMGTPGIWIFGSNDDVLREQGMGIVVEYAGRTGAPAWKDPTGDWDYSLFSDNTIAPKASQMIPMVISHIERSRDGFEQWLINGDAYSGKQEPVTLIRGRRYRFVFENKSDDAHPLHFHRSRFELIRVNGKVTSGLKKDVFLLKPFAKAEIDLVPTELGLLLFHCHQQFHMDSGFKKLFNVIVG